MDQTFNWHPNSYGEDLCNLAKRCLEKKDNKQDKDMAINYFEMAIDSGDLGAMYNLALLHIKDGN